MPTIFMLLYLEINQLLQVGVGKLWIVVPMIIFLYTTLIMVVQGFLVSNSQFFSYKLLDERHGLWKIVYYILVTLQIEVMPSVWLPYQYDADSCDYIQLFLFFKLLMVLLCVSVHWFIDCFYIIRYGVNLVWGYWLQTVCLFVAAVCLNCVHCMIMLVSN